MLDFNDFSPYYRVSIGWERRFVKGSNPTHRNDNGVKADDRVLIKLLGNWCQRTKKSDYFSSSFVWLVGSNPTYSSKKSGGFFYFLRKGVVTLLFTTTQNLYGVVREKPPSAL